MILIFPGWSDKQPQRFARQALTLSSLASREASSASHEADGAWGATHEVEKGASTASCNIRAASKLIDSGMH